MLLPTTNKKYSSILLISKIKFYSCKYVKAAQKKCAVPLAEDLNEKNYEDLLATAILNKVRYIFPLHIVFTPVGIFIKYIT